MWDMFVLSSRTSGGVANSIRELINCDVRHWRPEYAGEMVL